ncbi:MAG: hypothetical protein IPI64_09560 [Chloracidobacterium sp.]|nr:hypothetical protein [Chloracidobacterium sp.]
MKKILFVFAFVLTITFVGSGLGSGGTLSVNAQETMMGKIGDKTQNTAKKVYKRGKRIGHTIGSKTWNGSKWVASKSWRGGKWVLVKTVRGSKWVYRRAKRPFVTPKRNM